MLERGKLLIRAVDGTSLIEDVATGESLGTARPRRSGWLPVPPVLEVREAGDAPLLFTVRRAWSLSPRFDVLDAEGRAVGSVAGAVVADRTGRCLAVFGPDGTFRTRSGLVMGRVARTADGIEVGFGDSTAPDPFARMLLLAAALRG
jgi:hypothetical protein